MPLCYNFCFCGVKSTKDKGVSLRNIYRTGKFLLHIRKHRFRRINKRSGRVLDVTTSSPLFRSDYWHTDTEPDPFRAAVPLELTLRHSRTHLASSRWQRGRHPLPSPGGRGRRRWQQTDATGPFFVYDVRVGSTVFHDRTVTNNNSTVSRSVLVYCPTNFYYYSARPRYRRTNRSPELLKPCAPPPGAR